MINLEDETLKRNRRNHLVGGLAFLVVGSCFLVKALDYDSELAQYIDGAAAALSYFTAGASLALYKLRR